MVEDGPGLLFHRCSHRGTSLEYGRIEPEGLRCCYHGWLYDVEGNCLDMPLEPADSTHMERIKQPGYPVQEFGGLLCAYMGPPEQIPEFPTYDIWTQEGGTLSGWVGPASRGCHRLQLASRPGKSHGPLFISIGSTCVTAVPSFPSAIYADMPKRLDYEETGMGMKAVVRLRLAGRSRT